MKINEIKNSTVDYDIREIAYWTSKGIEIEGKTYPIEKFSIKETGLFATIALGNDQFSDYLIAGNAGYDGGPTEAELMTKQDNLVAGSNISINSDGKTINAVIPPVKKDPVFKGYMFDGDQNLRVILDNVSLDEDVTITTVLEEEGSVVIEGTHTNDLGFDAYKFTLADITSLKESAGNNPLMVKVGLYVTAITDIYIPLGNPV